jgi:cytochrome P450
MSMSLTQDVQFAGSLVNRFGSAVAVNAAAGLRTSFRRYRPQRDLEMTLYDPFNPATAAQPYDAYRRLLAGSRVHYSAKRSIWILSRLDDVRTAASADDELSSADGI